MANKTASFKTTIGFVDGDGVTRAVRKSVSVVYTSMVEGEIDVPDTTVSTTEYAIPFGSINASFVTGLLIENKTGQSLGLKINGGAADVTIADGAVLALGAPAADAETPLESLSLVTTATQSGLGTIAYKLFGDPEAPGP